jgi:UDP-3-O-acyl-N-acetylglucosamine deacetylase
MIRQTTIKKPVTVSGVGLHTGQHVNLTFHPAPDNHEVELGLGFHGVHVGRMGRIQLVDDLVGERLVAAIEVAEAAAGVLAAL